MIRLKPRTAASCLAVLLATGLAGCGADRVVRNEYPDDYRARHPIAVARGPETLDIDIGPAAFGLSERQKAEIFAFAYGYRTRGEGFLAVMVPAGAANERAARHALPEVRATLARAGIDPGRVRVQPYGSDGVAAIHLSYAALRAHTDECGLWPEDLRADPANHSYHNFGCASQQNLAAMVADPRDLISPRPETRPYASRRQEVLGKYGKGEDPSTNSRDAQKGSITSVGQ